MTDVEHTASEEVGFKDLDAAILVGAMPRREGMERKDLLAANVKIFRSQGAAIDKYAKKTVKVSSESLLISVVASSSPPFHCFIRSYILLSIPLPSPITSLPPSLPLSTPLSILLSTHLSRPSLSFYPLPPTSEPHTS